MNKLSGRMQTVGWIFFGLGFLIPFPMIFIYTNRYHQSPFDSPLIVFLMALFFGGSIVLLIGSSFVPMLMRRSKKMKGGLLVFGTIVSAEQTGLFVNEQPQLEITLQFSTANGEQVTSSDRMIVALTDLSEIRPGGLLPLRYDPEKPQNIILDLDVELDVLQAALDAQLVASGETTREKLDIRDNGVKAQGVVLSAQPTGKIVDGKGEMKLHINVVRPDDQGTFEVVTERPVSQQHLSDVQPGSVIEVYYYPWDEQNIVIAYRFS